MDGCHSDSQEYFSDCEFSADEVNNNDSMISDEADADYDYDYGYDMIDGVEEEDEDAAVKRVRHNKAKVCTALDGAEIRRRVEEAIAEVSGVLSVSRQDAIILLCSYNWSVGKVQDEWFADEAGVQRACGLLENSGFVDAEREFFCRICLENYGILDSFAAACGHLFCKDCWGNYVRIAINDGPGCLSLRCPHPKCGAAVGQEMIDALALEKDREKYCRFVVRSYVEDRKQKTIKWCPAPGCEYAVELDEVSGRNVDVMCKCSYGFCWNCLGEAHRPVDCEIMSKWTLKNNSEAENTTWILANSKPCPKCKRSIEKNHGCMHMTCPPPCKHHFCWLCLGPWSEHGEITGGFYACNSYTKAKEEGKHDQAEMKRQMAKNSLEKYTHYYERWASNDSARKKAMEDLRKMETENLERLFEKHGTPVTELEYIVDAWAQVVECRRILKWSYAYGYYLPEDEPVKKSLFEVTQGLAEHALDKLHGCAETELDIFLTSNGPLKGFMEFRTKLLDLTTVCRNYFDRLVRALENGLEDVDPQTTYSLNKKLKTDQN